MASYIKIVVRVQIVMVLEMAGHGDLLEYVRLRGALGEDKAKCMFSQLVSAVDYMHGFNVVHRYVIHRTPVVFNPFTADPMKALRFAILV